MVSKFEAWKAWHESIGIGMEATEHALEKGMNQMNRAEQEAWARNAESVERMRMQQAIDLREQEKALENRLRRDRRERIATAVLAGFVGSPDVGGPKKDAAVAVAYADALIAELDKEPKP